MYNLLLSGKWSAPDVDPCRNRGYKQMTSPNPGTDALVPLLLRLTTIAPSNSVDVGVQFLPRIFKITPDTYSMQNSAFVPRACDEIGPRS